MKLLKRLWLSLRGGMAYKELERQGQWATWQRPEEHEDEGGVEENVPRLDEHRD